MQGKGLSNFSKKNSFIFEGNIEGKALLKCFMWYFTNSFAQGNWSDTSLGDLFISTISIA